MTAKERTNRVVVYLNDAEHDALREVAYREREPMTEVMRQALADWMKRRTPENQ